jgi:hypothetical protein
MKKQKKEQPFSIITLNEIFMHLFLAERKRNRITFERSEDAVTIRTPEGDHTVRREDFNIAEECYLSLRDIIKYGGRETNIGEILDSAHLVLTTKHENVRQIYADVLRKTAQFLKSGGR